MGTRVTVPVQVPHNGGQETEQPGLPKLRQPSCDPASLYEEVTGILTNISGVRQRPLFALFSEYIDSDIFDELYSWRRELRQVSDGNSYDLLIHAPGGGLTTCYMVARLLCRIANDWEALVPERAWSGATLICLGSSNVVMSERSQLGPLDPQVGSKRREKFFAAERQSPLEAFEAVKYLREMAVSSLDAVMEVLTDGGLAPQKALETATSLAQELARPILEKIEPYDLGAFSLDSRLAETYCREIARPSDVAKKTQRRVFYNSLVQYYPAHEYAIDFEEAQSLRFQVSLPVPELDNLFDQLRPKFAGVKSYVGLVPPQREGI